MKLPKALRIWACLLSSFTSHTDLSSAPRSALPASMLWDGYSCSMKFLLPALPWLLISTLQVSEFVWDHVPSKFLSALYRYQPVFFFFFQCISQFLIMYWWVSPPLDFRSHEGRVLVYLVCPSLWLAPICSRVWGLVRRAAFQVPPLLPHRCSQRWAGSLPSTPALPFTHLWWDSYLCILSFSSLNWTSKIFLSQL